MSNVPNDLKYTKSHEWLRAEEDGSITVGITHHAQNLLGDMVFIELPETEGNYTTGDEIAVVESVKAASDVYCPVAGEIVTINEDLTDSPELINQDAYGAGWLFKIQPQDPGEIDELLSADDYLELITDEEH